MSSSAENNLKKIALIDDDQNLLDLLGLILEGSNKYEVEKFLSGLDAVKKVPRQNFDAAIIDLHLVHISGKSIVEELRSQGLQLPIIMLTADSSNTKLAECLDAGADDYVTKPFDKQALLARLDAIFRRVNNFENQQTTFKIGDITVDTQQVKVFRDSMPIDLTSTEFKLLLYLIKNQDKVVARDKILSDVWGYSNMSQTRVVDVHIANLRKKLNEGFDEKLDLVTTIRGFGYRAFVG